MELRVLQYFLVVAREENITAAAKRLNITQPTLSRQMAELEAELGTTLFLRGKRKITLTEDGMLLRKRAGEITDLVDKTQAELAAPPNEVSGQVYIGGGETHGMRLVARAIRELRDAHPLLRFQLYSGNADDVCERLDKGLLDFGVLVEPASLEKYNALRLPATDTWGLLMPKDSPLAQKQAIRPKDLLGIPLIHSRQSFVGGAFARWLQRGCESLNVVAHYNLIYNASLLVEQGVGYALCLDKLVGTDTPGGLCFRPLTPPLTSGLHVVWKKPQVLSGAAQAFLDALQSSFTNGGQT